MATPKIQSEIEVAFNSPQAKNLEKTIQDMLGMIDKFPKGAKDASGAVGEIVKELDKVKNSLRSTGSLNALITDTKNLAAALKSLNLLGKGLDLFSNKEVQQINKGASTVRAAAKAFDELRKSAQIEKGTFGLDETTLAGTTRAAKILQTELKAVQRAIGAVTGEGKPRVNTNDPLYQQGLQVQKNIENLRKYQQVLQSTQEQERRLATEQAASARRQKDQIDAERKQAEQFYKQRDGRVLAANQTTAFATSPDGQKAFVNKQTLANNQTARFADPGFVALQAARQTLADETGKTTQLLQQLGYRREDARLSQGVLNLTKEIRRLEGERTKELASGNAESARSLALATRIQQLTSQKQLLTQQQRRDDPERVKVEEQNRANSMMSRVTGAGGASLLAVQAALIANYAVLNTIRTGIGSVTSSAIEYEAAMKNVQAVTVTSGAEMVGLSEKIKQLSSDSRFSAVELANAALILGQAGLSAKQVGEALPSVVALATAAGSSIANTVDLVTSVIGVFDKQATDTADIANKVTQAANSSKISVEKLGLALQYAGNAAAQSGITFEETTAAIAAMSNAGIKGGSTLGTGLRQFITELQKPSEEFVSALRRVGLSISDVDVRANGLIGVLKTLGGAGFVAGDAIRSFDVRGAAAFNAMIANPADLDRQYEGLLKTNAALAATEIQMESFQSQSLRLGNTLVNLATTGLEPMQTILTGVFRSTSDVLQGMKDMGGVLQVVTGLAAAFISVGLLRHYGAMVPAILPWLGVSKSLAAAIGTTTTMTLSQVAANTGLIASNTATAASIGAVNASLVAMRPSIAVVYAMSGAMGVLRVAVNAVWASIVGMTLGTAAIVAGLGYLAYSVLTVGDSANKTKEAIDKLKGASNEAKGSFDETQSKVDSLTKKIEALYYKQNTLEGDSKKLQRTTSELNSQFGSLGLQIDDNNNSFTTMISKLRTLRSEMRTVAQVKLGVQIAAEETILKTQEGDFQSSVKSDRIPYVVGELEKFATKFKLLDSPLLTPTEKTAFRSGLSGAKDITSGSPQAVLALQNALGIASRIAPKEKQPTIDSFNKILNPFIEKAVGVIDTKSKLEGLGKVRTGMEEQTQFEKTANFPSRAGTGQNRMTRFEDSFRKPYPVLAEVQKENPNLKDGSLDLLFAMKDRTVKAMDNIDNVAKIVKAREASGELSPDLAGAKLRELNEAREQYQSTGVAYFKQNEKYYNDEMKDQIELTKKKARGAKGSEKRELLLKVGELEDKQTTLGEFGANEIMRARGRNRREIARVTADNASRSEGKVTAEQLARDASAAYRREADLYGLQAKGKKLDATNKSNTVEEVDGYLREGMDLITEEYKARVKSLIQEQKSRGPSVSKADTDFRAAEVQALQQEAIEKREQFVEGSMDIYKAVAKQAVKVGSRKDAAALAEDLKNLKSDAEDRLFEKGQALADIRGRVAQQLLPENSIEERQAILAETRAKIAEVTAELDFFGNETTGYIANLKKIAEEATAQVKKLQNDLLNGDELSKIKAKKLLPDALTEQNKANADLNSAFKDRQGTRGSLRGLQQDEFVQQATLPGEQTWDALRAKIEQVAGLYKQTVDEMDTVGEIGKGVAGALQGTTGIFSSFFQNLVSGTMSVSDAFKNMAVSVIKAMMDILAQALAMQAVKSILGLVMGMVGGGTSAYSLGGGAGTTLGIAGSGLKAATGGKITGGVKGKDSVPLMAMPGEFVLQTSAAEVLGDDFLHSLNNVSRGSISGSSKSSGVMSSSNSSGNGSGKTINFWVVSPDQLPPMGPEDVEISLSNKLMTGGPFKELIKSVASGNL